MCLEDVEGLRNCVKSLQLLEDLCSALGADFGKGDKLLSLTAQGRSHGVLEAALWAEVVLLGGFRIVAFGTNWGEF